MKAPFYTLLMSLFFAQAYAQVGINTTDPNPNAELDVNGKVVIRDYSRTSSGVSGVKAVFTEADGTLINVSIPSDLLEEDVSNNLTFNNSSSSRAAIEKIALIEQPFNTQNNLDLLLDGDHSDVTTFIIRKSSGGNELKIRGIQGGTEGRRIRIINDSGVDIKFEEDHGNANDGNKIYIYTGDDKMEEYGSCVLIYSTAISDSGGHWNIVQMDEIE